MPKIDVLTTQNVNLQFELAGLGERFAAAFVDIIIIILYFIFYQWVYSFFSVPNVFSGDNVEEGKMVMLILLINIPIMCYTFLMESTFQGRTVGKMLFKLQVVSHDGTKPSLSDFFLRWTIRIVDVWFLLFAFAFAGYSFWFLGLFLPLVGMVFIGKSGRNQRLGDILAQTYVIKAKKRLSLSETIYQGVRRDYTPKYTNVLQLQDKDIRMIKEVLENYKRTKNVDSVKLLASKAQEILEVQNPEPPLKFLRHLIKDYNYLANQDHETKTEGIHP